MIKVTSKPRMCGVNRAEQYDFDLYQLEEKTLLSTKEISVTVDFSHDNKAIVQGDIIAYGEWRTLALDECLKYLQVVVSENEILRDFKSKLKGLERLEE